MDMEGEAVLAEHIAQQVITLIEEPDMVVAQQAITLIGEVDIADELVVTPLEVPIPMLRERQGIGILMPRRTNRFASALLG